MAARVYITGAAGSGTSSLGEALAAALHVPHLDTDDFYWLPGAQPFTQKRPAPERVAQIAEAQVQSPNGGWVLSGSADGWGDKLLSSLDLILFLRVPTPLRLMRLRKREARRFGDRIAPGGDMERTHQLFLKWAASYEEPYFSGRSLHRHRDWLAGQDAPVLELDGTEPVQRLMQHALERLNTPT